MALGSFEVDSVAKVVELWLILTGCVFVNPLDRCWYTLPTELLVGSVIGVTGVGTRLMGSFSPSTLCKSSCKKYDGNVFFLIARLLTWIKGIRTSSPRITDAMDGSWKEVAVLIFFLLWRFSFRFWSLALSCWLVASFSRSNEDCFTGRLDGWLWESEDLEGRLCFWSTCSLTVLIGSSLKRVWWNRYSQI